MPSTCSAKIVRSGARTQAPMKSLPQRSGMGPQIVEDGIPDDDTDIEVVVKSSIQPAQLADAEQQQKGALVQDIL